MHKVVLRDTRNGWTKTIIDDYGSAADYIWTEGNYSCDCNRSLFLYDWDESKELGCNTGENIIELVSIAEGE